MNKFPKSAVNKFYQTREYPPTRPLGQEFVDYMGLKPEDAHYYELQQSNSELARATIIKNIDWQA